MKAPISRLVSWQNLLRASTLAAALSAVFSILAIVSSDFSRRIEELASAGSDRVQWTLSQVEVEYLWLHHQLHEAMLGGTTDPDTIRHSFDIFFSRVDTLRASPPFDELRQDPEFGPNLDVIWAALQACVSLVDGPDEALLAGLGPMQEGLQNVYPQIRELALHGNTYFAAQADISREEIAETLKRVALITLILLCILLAMVFVLWRSFQVSRSHARDARLSSERMTAVVSTALDAVVVSDRSGRIIEFNGGAEDIFGYHRDEVLYRTIGDVMVPNALRKAHSEGMRKYHGTGIPRVIGKGRRMMEARRKDGSVFPVELSISATTRSDGEQIFVAFLRDVTKRVAADRELRDAHDTALAGERAKDRLLAVMSHEMRTPLNGMLGALEMLDAAPLDARQQKLLSVAKSSGNLLLHHVNDVLDISRIDSGQLDLDRRALDLNAVIRDVVESQQIPAERAGNRIETAFMPDDRATVTGDPVRLQQVLLNLVGNAVKFTRDGTIHVTAERLGEDNMVEFSVADTGIGIEAEDRDRVFDDFVTLDASYGRPAAGTGLGLGITRRMVEAMGGQIGVESETGEGSLFWVRLPLPPADPAEALPAARSSAPLEFPAAPQPLHVLVVEDNAVNRLVVREMLESAGHRVTEAGDGDDGAAAARATKYDLILMDISMPRVDGITATRLIRSEGGASARTPIIALTAHAFAADIERFRDAGMAHTLTKPITREALRFALDLARGKAPPRPGPVAADGPPAPSDNLVDLSQIEGLAEEMGDERLHALIADFVAEGDAAIAQITAINGHALSGPDLALKIHKLAGSSAVFGARVLHACLNDAETAANAGQPADRDILLAVWTRTRGRYLAFGAASGVDLAPVQGPDAAPDAPSS